MLFCVVGFTIATYLVGQAESLETVVLWRIVQGGIGAPVIPLANAIVLDSFPRKQAGLVSSIFGMTVVLGPVMGPVFGGQLAEAYGWRWAFYMIVPAGVLASFALWATLPEDEPGKPIPLDWTGFLALTVAISCVQLVLSRGQRLDWFESHEIIIETAIAEKRGMIIVSASSGARMQEGMLSLMQMAKTCGALARLSEAKLPFISLLTHPTTGGVTASFATIGDINLAEPKCMIGFAGPRVVKETTHQNLPPGFQTAEFMLEHGLVDAIVHRGKLRERLASLLSYMMPR
jgi:MFS family permease